ncbi:hypothetical protein PHLGIDRAFT_178864 [Phlebiopsis gigantea 11061_1 CR5-6]|uniref:Uncharacterized protein n=1 Tax=Phlebiopsis gigantea (strain 11061_1 CR5-6) TaxID=745531 RepID=A0A0C3S7S9_PHLG1|nr:hypothetical protein PHLGIDRAFT_178864 [Phlebiopsis gigantea 11061_1 CR5-6]
MSKNAKKIEKGNRNITDFFARRSSISTPSSQLASQPSSSQPAPSQKSSLKPGLKRKTVLTKTAVVDVSSDSESIDERATYAHTIRSRTNNTADSVAVVAGPSSSANKSKIFTSKKASVPSKATMTPSTSQSSAKTTVKRRVKSTTTVLMSVSSTRPIVRKKRKLDWDDSTDDEMFKPDPGVMKAGLARAPVPRLPASSAKATKVVPSRDAPSSLSGPSTSSKRRRISGTAARHHIDHTSGEEGDNEEIPASYSNELELELPRKKKGGLKAKEVKASVDRWRRETSVLTVDNGPTPPLTDSPLTSPSERSPTPELAPFNIGQVVEDSIMDVDMTEAANLLQGMQPHQGSDVEVSQQIIAEEDLASLSSLTSVISDLEPSTPSPPAPEPEAWVTRPVTPPPPDELPPMPPTPVALDVATKTAQTIARIKAAAQAAAREQLDSSEDQIQLDDLSDSDLESLDFNIKPVQKATPPPQPKGRLSSPLTSMGTSPEPEQPEAGPSTRYNFRRRSSPSDQRRCLASPDDDADMSRRPPPPKKSVANPLDKLLREKKKNAKTGKGIDDIRLAEAAMHEKALVSKSKGKMREEMDREEDSDDEMWADETAAARIAHQGTQRLKLSTSDNADDTDSDGEDNELDIAEATKHLGDEQGAAVGKILDKDRKGWLRKGRAKKNGQKGVSLWEDPVTDAESVLDEDSELPSLPLGQDDVKSDRIFDILQAAVQKQGKCQCVLAYIIIESRFP